MTNVALWLKHAPKVTVDPVSGAWHVTVDGSNETRVITAADIVEKAESERPVRELERLIGEAYHDILRTIEKAAQP